MRRATYGARIACYNSYNCNNKCYNDLLGEAGDDHLVAVALGRELCDPVVQLLRLLRVRRLPQYIIL